MSEKFDSDCEVIIEDELEEGELSDKNIPKINFKSEKKDLRNHKEKKNTKINQKLLKQNKDHKSYNHKKIPYAYQNHHRLPNCKSSEKLEKTIPSRQSSHFHTNYSTTKSSTVQKDKKPCDRNSSKKRSPQRTKERNESASKRQKLSPPKSVKKPRYFEYGRSRNVNYGMSRYMKVDNEATFDQLLEKYKTIQSELAKLGGDVKSPASRKRSISVSHKNTKCNDSKNVSQENKSRSSLPVENKSTKCHSEKSQNSVSVRPVEIINKSCDEDSELEQLRLQALASRAATGINKTRSNNGSPPPLVSILLPGSHPSKIIISPHQKPMECSLIPTIENDASSKHEKNISSAFSVAEKADNHEVLDMDFDADDTLKGKTEAAKVETEDDLDLEAAILRAQLLESLNLAKARKAESKVEEGVLVEQSPSVVNHVGPEIHQADRQILAVMPAQIEKKVEKIDSRPNNKISKPMSKMTVSYQKLAPFIINLDEDSTSSEDECEEVENHSNSNPILASLDRLINCARNESEAIDMQPSVSNKDNLEIKPDIPEIEREEPVQVLSGKTGVAKKSINITSLKNYSMYSKKLKKVEAMIVAQNSILESARERSNEKKAVFITSQVEVRRLQEKFDAAKKIMEVNKGIMFQANALLRNVQSSIKNSHRVLIDLRNTCSKLEKQIFGKNVLSPTSAKSIS